MLQYTSSARVSSAKSLKFATVMNFRDSLKRTSNFGRRGKPPKLARARQAWSFLLLLLDGGKGRTMRFVALTSFGTRGGRVVLRFPIHPQVNRGLMGACVCVSDS